MCDPTVPQELDTSGVYNWCVYNPPKWHEQALANIFSTILEAIKMVRNALDVAFSVFYI